MNVIFPYWGIDEADLAEMMVNSVTRCMPYAKVIQQTDEKTPQLPFVDEVWRKTRTGDFIEHRFGMLSELKEECLSLDYDVIVQADLSHVFNDDWDVCLTDAGGESDPTRFNSGVMFLRPSGNGFWREVVEEYQKYKDGWMGGQVAVAKVVKKTSYRVKRLDRSEYNYTPHKQSEDVSKRLVVHYKGLRKQWMREL